MIWFWRNRRGECDRLRTELAAAQQRLERVIDNALFAAGSLPIFHPEDPRFQPRTAAAQQAEAARQRPPLSAGEWRQQIEAVEAERSVRDRKARLVAQLRTEAQLRREAARNPQETSNAQ
ncbi:MAG: hypothetical protein ACRD0Y_12685 [Terriglobales bacterium]